MNFFLKSHNAKKTEREEDLWDFSTSILLQNSKKIERVPFGGKKIWKKSYSAEKTLKG